MSNGSYVQRIAFNNGKALSYAYDEAGNITAVRNENGELLEEYTYDLLGRLKTERNTKGGFYVVYEYDAGGNILSKKHYTVDGVTLQKEDTYRYNDTWKDMLLSYNGEAIAYDASGNPTLYRGKTATWEKGRQLKSFGANTYKYNASGVRISKTVDGVEHRYFVEGIKVLREEFGSHVLDFLYGVDGEAVGFTDNGMAYYYYKNLQGDVIGITDKDGVLIATYAYDAWGKPISVEGDLTIANLNPIRYRGYYYDTETGLYYLNSRYYDPEVCRFINADDPVLIVMLPMDQINIFVYCSNNPINKLDKQGNVTQYTKNNTINNFVDRIIAYIPNIYTADFWGKEKEIFNIGTKNLYLKIGIGASAQTNKSALFGGMFSAKNKTLEVTSYFGINQDVSLGFSVGISWRKAYIKTGIMVALPRKYYSGACIGAYIEISIPTWILAAVAVATAVVCVYAPAIGGYIAKAIACIRQSIRAAAPIISSLMPKLIFALI